MALFAKYFNRSPQELGPEEVRKYQHYLVEEKKASWASFNQTVCALRFLYRTTLGKVWAVEHIPYPKHESRLPVVRSVSEVWRFFDNVLHVMCRTILQTMYATGLRLTEALNLKPSDIDSERMVIRVEQSKGDLDRSPVA